MIPDSSYDLTKSMFSRGNISEKIRFSKFEVEDEIIVDCFVGLGYWVLQLSKKRPPLKVYCVDMNPNQLKSLERNIDLNKVDRNRFELIEGDCTKVQIPVKANRVFLGLIPCCCFALEKAVSLLDRSKVGMVHVHHNYTDLTKVKHRPQGLVFEKNIFRIMNSTIVSAHWLTLCLLTRDATTSVGQ